MSFFKTEWSEGVLNIYKKKILEKIFNAEDIILEIFIGFDEAISKFM